MCKVSRYVKNHKKMYENVKEWGKACRERTTIESIYTKVMADGWTSAFVPSGGMCSLQNLHRTAQYIQICKQDTAAWQEVD